MNAWLSQLLRALFFKGTINPNPSKYEQNYPRLSGKIFKKWGLSRNF
jgi:hypothetical protein